MSREFKQTTSNRETMLEVSSTFNSKKLLDSQIITSLEEKTVS